MIVALALLAGAPASVPADEPACVGRASTSEDAEGFVTEALDVLRSCGHDPADYRLALREDDPFVAAGARRKPVLSAVFLPNDPKRHYAIAVRATHPCVLSWVWKPADFTDWQRRVLARAEELARNSDLPRIDGQLLDVSVTESLEFVGVEVLDAEPWRDGPSPELRILMHKDDLILVESN